ncbi:MAG: hypothetical protein U0797_13585 [Gemmataceae bacterium]
MHVTPTILLGVAALLIQAGLAAADPPVPKRPESLSAPPSLPTTTGCEDGDYCGIIGGAGIYFVQPFFQNNPSYYILQENQNPLRGTGTFHFAQRVDISHHVELAPVVWLGYVAESGLGGRARYWSFRAGTDQSVKLPPSPGPVLSTVFSATPLGLQGFGDTLFQPNQHGRGVVEPTAVSITSKLDLQVVDLEALQEARAGDWDFLLSGGARLARVAQSYNFFNLQPTANPLVLRALLSSHVFDGAGPVLAVEARRPLCDCGLTFYGGARGAFLFGRAKQDAGFGGTTLRNDDANPQTASERRDRGMAVFDLELGLEYGGEVCGSWVFGQVAVVGQDWLGAGNASRSAGNTFREGAPVGGAPQDSDIAFFGLAVRLGVNY